MIGISLVLPGFRFSTAANHDTHREHDYSSKGPFSMARMDYCAAPTEGTSWRESRRRFPKHSKTYSTGWKRFESLPFQHSGVLCAPSLGSIVETATKPRILDSHVESVEKLLLCEANVPIIRRNSGGRNVVPLPSGPRDSSASLNASKVGRIKTDSYKPYNGQNDL